jgi:predicted secreted hydrolase
VALYFSLRKWFDLMENLLRGFLIGISIAAPVGPIGVLCIRRTLAYGLLVGFISGLGAAAADALYGSIAGFGLAFLAGFLVEQQIWLRLVGGIFLIYLGIKTFFARPARHEAQAQGEGRLGAFFSTFFLTLTNPMTILSFVAIFAGVGLGGQTGSYLEAGVLVLGVFLGSACWWLILSSAANLFRGRMNTRALTWVNRGSGLIILIFGTVVLWGAVNPKEEQILQNVGAGLPTASLDAAERYTQADGTYPITFPQDFGAHPDYQTEWWYYTGNLHDPQGRRFGYQLTFFRRALVPPQERVERASEWGTEQVYLAHLAITDADKTEHEAFERLSRGAVGLAGAESEPFRVWLEDWEVQEVAPATYRLKAAVPSEMENGLPSQRIALDLILNDLKGPILQGEQGYSQKGPEAGDASYYFSQTRLVSQGTLQIDGQRFPVQGTSWMDHEFSTSALSPGQVGWDWFSIQLEDGSELMVFQIRREDGSIDPFSSGTWIAPDGTTRFLEKDDFKITAQETWRSPSSGAVYPSRWSLEVPEVDLELDIRPVILNQEMDLNYQYWEGAVDITARKAGEQFNGVGYVELTGYGRSMAGEF